MICVVCGRRVPPEHGARLYCRRACKAQWKRSGSPRASLERPLRLVLDALLTRIERAVSSRAGAHRADAWNPERWRRELVADIPLQLDVVAVIVAGLDDAYRNVQSPQDVRDVTERLRTRLDRLTLEAEKIIDANPPPHVVYLLADAYGELLYVGITDRGPRRLVEHAREKPWWPRVATVNFERHASRDIALAREEHLIRSRHPRYNIVHNLSMTSR